MGREIIRFIWAHLDALVALLLAAAYLGEVYLGDTTVAGEPFVAGLDASETVAVAAGAAFLLSLALRSRMPVVPVVVAIVAAVLIGHGAGGRGDRAPARPRAGRLLGRGPGAAARAAAIGALGLGALAGVLVLRGGSVPARGPPRSPGLCWSCGPPGSLAS